jgi:predicted O-methyltransferase YrrM
MTTDTTVFEYGTGGSTLFLAQRALSVESVENEEAWLVKTRGVLEKQALKNVNLHFEPFDFSNLAGFEQSSYLQKLSQSHDLIVVDGEDHYHFDQKFSARSLCFRHAQEFVQPGGIILVDDSWRYPEIRESSHCKKLVVHESTGPCRKGVTSTDLHYY